MALKVAHLRQQGVNIGYRPPRFFVRPENANRTRSNYLADTAPSIISWFSRTSRACLGRLWKDGVSSSGRVASILPKHQRDVGLCESEQADFVILRQPFDKAGTSKGQT
jgi:hypothetical protein